jgi:Tol biopolymer transport system component
MKLHILFLTALTIAFTIFVAAQTRAVTVTEGTNVNVTLSPDHKTIIMDLQETLWSLPVAGGAAKRLTEPFLEPARPDWSPRGDWVAFQSYKGGTFHIWLMKPDGSGLRQLTDGHGDDREPRFSPDGTKVAFSSDRAFKGSYDIWVADVATGKLTQWTSSEADEYEPAWLPDGRIAFISGAGANGTTIQSSSGSGESNTILNASAGARVDSPTFSPDGQRVAYTEISGGKARMMVSGQPVGTSDDVFPFPSTWLSSNEILYTGNGEIFVTNLTSGDTRTIPFQATFNLNRAAYKHRQIDFDTASPRQVKGILNPMLSPDGKRVVFEALNQLWLMDIGGKPAQLTHDNFYKQSPAWSPDGRQIAFCSDKAGAAAIYVLDTASKTERRITKSNDEADTDPAWSPDGTKIAYLNQNGAGYIVDVSSGVTVEAVKQSYEPGRMSWSANGKTVSLAVLRPYSRRYREGTSVIESVDLATGKITLTEPAPYASISSRGPDGPIYSPDGTRLAYVMGGHLWVRAVDADGIPTGQAHSLNEEMADAPSWSGDGKRLLYLSAGKLRLAGLDGSASTVTVDLSWHRDATAKKVVVHAGHLWDGTGPNVRDNVDITIVGRRIQKIEAHRDALHSGAEVIDASELTVLPGLWEGHNHGYGGLSSFGDRAGRLWLAYGFTELQSQGDSAYDAQEVRESFGAGRRVGPRYFSTGELMDGERIYYGMAHSITNSKELQMEFARAQAMEYDNLKTYVRLPHELQSEVMKFAHDKLGVWAASHYGLPGTLYGMDGMTHVSATSRWGYSYTRSAANVTYGDIRKLFAAANEFIISTPFAASALYAEDPKILDDPRIATLNTPWQQRVMLAARDQAIRGNGTTTGPATAGLAGLQHEEEALLAVLHAGGTVVLGTDSPLPGLAIVNHLGLRAEVKYGFQPWEALQTATINAAKAFGYGKDLGSVEAGKLADLVFVAGQPLKDIKDVAKVQRVMVDGRVYTIPELTAPFAK